MPALAGASNALKDNQDVAILGMSVDGAASGKEQGVSAAKEIVENKQLPYPNVVWCGKFDALAQKLGLEFTPFNALVTPDGAVLKTLELPEDAREAEDLIKKELLGALDQGKSETKE